MREKKLKKNEEFFMFVCIDFLFIDLVQLKTAMEFLSVNELLWATVISICFTCLRHFKLLAREIGRYKMFNKAMVFSMVYILATWDYWYLKLSFLFLVPRTNKHVRVSTKRWIACCIELGLVDVPFRDLHMLYVCSVDIIMKTTPRIFIQANFAFSPPSSQNQWFTFFWKNHCCVVFVIMIISELFPYLKRFTRVITLN